jgi:excisionase family DNA binding protein
MSSIQFIQVSPTELANLINEGIKEHLHDTIKELLEQQPNQKELMTRQETKKYFNVSLVTLHSWVNKGIIKKYKVGNKTFFKRSELEKVVSNSNNAA